MKFSDSTFPRSAFGLHVLFLLMLSYCIVPLTAFQVSVGSDAVSKTQSTSTCGSLQEFACNNDKCDTCAGSDHGGTCRNGGSFPCGAGADCSSPQAGHCLESTWCAPGKHVMPTAGTPKHFKCLSVTGLGPEEVLVIYRNTDFTGDACVVSTDGAWAAPGDQLSNAVDTTPAAGAQFSQCRKAGQAQPQQATLIVRQNGGTCPADGGDGDPTAAPSLAVVNHTYWYSNADENMRRLRKRGDDFRVPDSRTIAAAAGIFLIALQQINNAFQGVLEAISQANAQGDQDFLGGPLANAWEGDHMMELQLMQAFFNTNPGGGQWAFIWQQMQDQTNCPELYQRVTNVVNNGNLVGIAKRINRLKGNLFLTTDSGGPASVVWTRFLRVEVEALLAYLQGIQPNFQNIVDRVGRIMDDIWNAQGAPGTSSGRPPSQEFVIYARGRWDAVLRRVQLALNANQFRNPAELDSLYDQGEL